MSLAHSPRFRHRYVCVLSVATAFAFSAVLFMFVIAPYSGASMLDPWIYTGYSIDYAGLSERFGQTYYSTRVSSIWPAEAAMALIGDHGFLVWSILRFGIMISCCGLIGWLIAGPRVGIAFAAITGSSVWVLRTLLDDYTQGSSLTYLALAAALFSAATLPTKPLRNRYRLVMALISGVCLELSINSHPSILTSTVPIALAIITTDMMRRTAWYRSPLLVRGMRRRVSLVIALIIGFALGYVALAAVVMMRLGWNLENLLFERITLQFSQQLADGLARNWAVPINNSYAVLFLLPLLISTVALLVTQSVGKKSRGSRPKQITQICTVAAITQAAIMLYSHYVLGGGGLGWPFSVVMLSPVALLAVLALLVSADATHRISNGVTGLVVVASLFLSFIAPRLVMSDRFFFYLWIFCLLTALAFASVSAGRRWISRPPDEFGAQRSWMVYGALFAVVGLVGAAPFAMESGAQTGIRGLAGYRALAVKQPGASQSGLALRTASREFLQFAQGESANSEVIRVWYPPGPSWLNSVQSTLLWGYTCVGCAEARTWPDLTPQQMEAVRGSNSLLVLTETLQEQNLFWGYARDALPSLQRMSEPRSIGKSPYQAYVSSYRFTST